MLEQRLKSANEPNYTVDKCLPFFYITNPIRANRPVEQYAQQGLG
jgi:hypothetical protein